VNLRSILLLAALVVWAVTGCGPPSASRRAWTAEDPWYQPPPDQYWTWPKLDPGRIHEVAESLRPEAEAMLEQAPIVEVTAAQATRLLGGELSGVPGTQPYLVRGLRLDPRGHFRVYVAEDALVVSHSTLGHVARPMLRQPLIVQLEARPAQIFVYCKMAE
jgi:hypothetical protein